MKHYFLISATQIQSKGGHLPPVERFCEGFPFTNRKEIYNFYIKSLESKNRDVYRFLECRGEEQKYWIQQWNAYLLSPTMIAINRFDSHLFQGLRSTCNNLNDNIWIICPFHGLIQLTESIPNYRLRPDAFLPGCGHLTNYWTKILAKEIARRAHQGIVWNLLDTPWPGLKMHLDFESYFEIQFKNPSDADEKRLLLINNIESNKPSSYYESLQMILDLDPSQLPDHFLL